MTDEPVTDEPVTDGPAADATAADESRRHPWSGSLYGWLWRRLPGRWPAKVALLGAAAAAVVALLFVVVFPWVEPRLPVNQVTVGGHSGGG